MARHNGLMTAFRWGATILVVAIVIAGLDPLLIEPWSCNQQKKLIEQEIDRFARRGDPVSAARALESSFPTIRRCREVMPADVEPLMELAALYRLVARDDDAVAVYHEALSLDRRPEIYHNLSVTLMNLGREDEAAASYARNIAFDRSAFRARQFPKRVQREADRLSRELTSETFDLSLD